MRQQTLSVRQRPHSTFPEFGGLFSGFPTWLSIRPVFDNHLIRMRNGRLTIKAERTESKESNRRSEFSYGSFERSVMLPVGADEGAITAGYDNGIPTVSVPVAVARPAESRIPAASASSE
jgi:HSP20 family protein